MILIQVSEEWVTVNLPYLQRSVSFESLSLYVLPSGWSGGEGTTFSEAGEGMRRQGRVEEGRGVEDTESRRRQVDGRGR